MNLNKVLIAGHLTRDPEIKYTPKGTAVADIGLAINRTWTDNSGEKKEETTFVDVTLWGRQAEVAHEYLKKGRPVFIEGRLFLDTWTDKQTQQKRSRLRVVGENLQMLGSRDDSGSSPAGTQPPQARPTAPAPAPTAPPVKLRSEPPDLDAEPDDIPF
jgi:single-strand DNA-binding protein